MSLLLFFLAIGALVVVVHRVESATGEGRRRPGGMRYAPVPLLVNESERAAWRLLHELPLGAHAVCPKVRMEDFLNAQGPEWHRLRGHVKSRHVDFLLVDEEWRPILAVEVDGASHDRPDRSYADAVKNQAMDVAGVSVLHLRVGEDWRAPLLAWRAARTPTFLPAAGARSMPTVPLQRRRA